MMTKTSIPFPHRLQWTLVRWIPNGKSGGENLWQPPSKVYKKRYRRLPSRPTPAELSWTVLASPKRIEGKVNNSVRVEKLRMFLTHHCSLGRTCPLKALEVGKWLSLKDEQPIRCSWFQRSRKAADNFCKVELDYDPRYAPSSNQTCQKSVVERRTFFAEILYFFRYKFGDNVALLARTSVFSDVELTDAKYPYISATSPAKAPKIPCVVNIQDIRHLVGFIPSSLSNKSYIVWPYMLPITAPKESQGRK